MENEKKFSIEEALEALEKINETLSRKDITLDESIRLYQEGTKIAARCREELKGVEKKLEILDPETAETDA